MKNVLVMGGSYFIGKKIVDFLKHDGYNISILNRGTKIVNDPMITQIKCNRYDFDMMKNALKDKQFEIVIDVSCLCSEQAKILTQALDTQVLEKLIFISSSAVYKIDDLKAPFAETDLLGVNSFWYDYGTNKIEAEDYYKEYINSTKASLVILRPPYVYGENNYAQRESFIFEHITNNQPVIIPKSNCCLQFIYTGDIAKIITTLLLNEQSDKINIYNVGNSRAVTAREWVEFCCKVTNKSIDIIEYDYFSVGRYVRDFFPFPDYDNILNVDKIKSIYSDETDFTTGLKAAYDWFLNNRSEIKFKDNVTLNEKSILSELGLSNTND